VSGLGFVSLNKATNPQGAIVSRPDVDHVTHIENRALYDRIKKKCGNSPKVWHHNSRALEALRRRIERDKESADPGSIARQTAA
jgi:hypothetical protein